MSLVDPNARASTVKTGKATKPASNILLKVQRSIKNEIRRILESDSTVIYPMTPIISIVTANHSYYQLVVHIYSIAVTSMQVLPGSIRT